MTIKKAEEENKKITSVCVFLKGEGSSSEEDLMRPSLHYNSVGFACTWTSKLDFFFLIAIQILLGVTFEKGTAVHFDLFVLHNAKWARQALRSEA